MFTVYRSPFAVGTRARCGGLRALCCDSLNEPRQHLFDVRRCTLQNLGLPWGEKSQIARQQGKTNHFVCRAGRNVKELPEFGASSSSTSLGNIGRNGRSGSSHLAGQAKSLRIGIRGRRAINTQRQSLAFLPHFQFPEVLHALTILTGEKITQVYTKSLVPHVIFDLAKQTSLLLDPPIHIALTANGERQTANASGDMAC